MPLASNPTQGCQWASCFFPVVTVLSSAFIASLGVSVLLRGTTSVVVTFRVTAASIAMDFLSLIQDWGWAPVSQSGSLCSSSPLLGPNTPPQELFVKSLLLRGNLRCISAALVRVGCERFSECPRCHCTAQSGVGTFLLPEHPLGASATLRLVLILHRKGAEAKDGDQEPGLSSLWLPLHPSTYRCLLC